MREYKNMLRRGTALFMSAVVMSAGMTAAVSAEEVPAETEEAEAAEEEEIPAAAEAGEEDPEETEEEISAEPEEGGETYGADIEYDLMVGDVVVTDANSHDILGDGTTWFDPATSTLTLNGTYTRMSAAGNGISSLNMDLVIEGNAVIDVSGSEQSAAVSVFNGNLTVNGDISAVGGRWGILCYKNLLFSGGTVYAEAKSDRGTAVTGITGITVEESADRLEMSGGLEAMSSDGGLTFDQSRFRILAPEDYEISDNGLIRGPDGSSPQHIIMEADSHFTVRYDPGNGSGSMKNTIVFAGEKYYLPECEFAAPDEMKFTGWLGDDGRKYMAGEEAEITADCAFTAQWDDLYNLTVGGVTVAKENKNDIFGDGTARYDSESSTLFLNGTFDYRDADNLNAFVTAKKMDLTVSGSAVIMAANSYDNAVGIDVADGKLTLDGDFDIAAQSYGIYAYGGLELSGGNISISADQEGFGIRTHDGDIVFDSGIASLQLHGTKNAVSTSAAVVIDDNLLIQTPEGGKISDSGRNIEDADGNNAKDVVIRPRQKYIVSFDAGSGSGEMEDIYVMEGYPLLLPECLFAAPEEAEFGGWKDSEGNIYKENDPAEIQGDCVFAAHWNPTYSLKVGGVPVGPDNKNDILGDGSASFDSKTNTLTLNGTFSAAGLTGIGFVEAENMDLRIEGNAEITVDENSWMMMSVYVTDGSLTLSGNFRLTGKSRAVYGYGVTIESGTLYAETFEERGIPIGSHLGSLTITGDVERLESVCDYRPISALDGYYISDQLYVEEPAGGSIQNGFVYDADGNQVTHLVLARREQAEPEFSGHQLVLSGSLGLRFGMKFPEGFDTAGSYMEFTVSGVKQIVFTSDAEEEAGRTIYTCDLNTLQMAEEIEAAFCYNGQVITQTFSLADYFTYFDENPSQFDAQTLSLVKAVADYGYYAQPYLVSANSLEGKYAPITKHYTESYDFEAVKEAVSGYTFAKAISDSAVEKASYKLSLDSDTALTVLMQVPAGTELTASAVFGGKTYTAEKLSDTVYAVKVTGIKASQLGNTITVNGSAEGDFTITVSALSYVRTVLNSSKYNNQAKNTVCALYKYHEAAEEFLNRQN